jgi:hypothetical protein
MAAGTDWLDHENRIIKEIARMTYLNRWHAVFTWRGMPCLLLCLFASLSARANWGMNDATIIYPLPQSEEDMNRMPGPRDQGTQGALLPLKYWQRIPPINQGENPARTYRNLRVVAVRLDPCFRFAGDCLPQVRLVWQPIDKAAYGSALPFGLEAKDAAVHSFYTLEPVAFRQLIAEYDLLGRASGRRDTDAPLQIHPVIRQQGLGGSFAQGLKRLLLKYCGEASLWRVTSMSTLVGGDKWEFRGFDIVGGKPVEISIPRTGNATRQSFFVSLVSDRDYSNGRIAPVPSGEDNLAELLRDSRSLGTKGAGSLKTLGEAVARIENPDIHSPESMDCVSCHATQVAGALLFERIPWLSRDPQVTRHAYRSSFPLQNQAASQNRPRVFRALGYFERSPVLSRRVINETAAVVSRLNSQIPRQSPIPSRASDPRQGADTETAAGYETPWVVGASEEGYSEADM